MSNNELMTTYEKLVYLEKINPLKFENFKGRLDALYEIEIEKQSKDDVMHTENLSDFKSV